MELDVSSIDFKQLFAVSFFIFLNIMSFMIIMSDSNTVLQVKMLYFSQIFDMSIYYTIILYVLLIIIDQVEKRVKMR